MIALTITDTKDFMTKLLTKDTFDTFLFSEGSVTTFTTFSADGTWHPDFFEEKEQSEQVLNWKLVRPFFYDMIKGRHTPIHMRVVLKLADYNVEKLLKNSGLAVSKDQVDGLFLNLTYAKDEVHVTTGTSLKVFLMDRSLDRLWDDMVRKFFQSRGIQAE